MPPIEGPEAPRVFIDGHECVTPVENNEAKRVQIP